VLCSFRNAGGSRAASHGAAQREQRSTASAATHLRCAVGEVHLFVVSLNVCLDRRER
jgi:hypothetical protein